MQFASLSRLPPQMFFTLLIGALRLLMAPQAQGQQRLSRCWR